jgi:hypothetical protein
MSTAGRVLSEKMDVLQLAFYTAPVSCCVLLPFFWFLEVRPLAALTSGSRNLLRLLLPSKTLRHPPAGSKSII